MSERVTKTPAINPDALTPSTDRTFALLELLSQHPDGAIRRLAPDKPGSLWRVDLLQSTSGLPREKAKYLRVWQLDYKTYSTWKKAYRHSGPAVSIVQEEGVKRILSEVPVEADGSVHFTAPAGLTTLRPMQYLSAASRLIELASSGRHHQVQVDPVSLHRLIAWVDACCPYHGEPELRAMGDPDFPGIDTLPIRPRVATAPVIERP
jgi:hypothetical protein